MKYPRALALEVTKEIVEALRPHCDRLIVAGSLRRRKEEVGDIEILYISHFSESADPIDLFGGTIRVNQTEEMIRQLCADRGIIKPRRNVCGSEMWGPWNKLGTHIKTGIPIDLFATTHRAWFNYLVCRTGSKENNMRIASAAQAKGWAWKPYSSGFVRTKPLYAGDQEKTHTVHSEEDVFKFVGLPYLEPWER